MGRIIFSNTLTLIPSVGKWGVWLATALTWLITGIASLIRYRQGKWMRIHLVERPLPKNDELTVEKSLSGIFAGKRSLHGLH